MVAVERTQACLVALHSWFDSSLNAFTFCINSTPYWRIVGENVVENQFASARGMVAYGNADRFDALRLAAFLLSAPSSCRDVRTHLYFCRQS